MASTTMGAASSSSSSSRRGDPPPRHPHRHPHPHPHPSSSAFHQVTTTTSSSSSSSSSSTSTILATASTSSAKPKKRKRRNENKKQNKNRTPSSLLPLRPSPRRPPAPSSLRPAPHKRRRYSTSPPPPPPSIRRSAASSDQLDRNMRTTTRPSYQATASLSALQPRSPTPLPLTLLLDLNGTLLLRKERKAASSIAPTHRPYLRSFLLYALGVPSQHEEALARNAQIDRTILHNLNDWPSQQPRMNKKANVRRNEAVSRLHALSKELKLDLSIGDTANHRETHHPDHDDDDDDSDGHDQQQEVAIDDDDQHGPWAPLVPASSSSRAPNPAALNPRLHVIIWSSAKPENVQRMIRSMCLPSWKSPTLESRTRIVPNVGAGPNTDSSLALLTRIQHIWSRDTLVPIDSHAYNNKVQCIKDLEIVWWALNYEAAAARHPDREKNFLLWKSGYAASFASKNTRLFASERSRQDWARPDEDGLDWVPAFSTTSPAKSTEPLPSPTSSSENISQLASGTEEEHAPLPKIGQTSGTGSAAAEAAYLANKLGPWSAKNTLLLDDTPAKAALQPFNHLCVPEFTEEEASIAKEVREQIEYELGATAPSDDSGRLSAWNQDVRLLNGSPVAAAKLDNVLLQLVGVLDEARHQPNVAAWIRAGGLEGFGGRTFRPRNADEGQVRQKFKWDSPQTADGWAERGRNVLQRLGLPLLV